LNLLSFRAAAARTLSQIPALLAMQLGIVFGSDYCGSLGALEKALPVIQDQPDPDRSKKITERTSRDLLGL